MFYALPLARDGERQESIEQALHQNNSIKEWLYPDNYLSYRHTNLSCL